MTSHLSPVTNQNGHWFEADWLRSKCDALSSNRKVDGSRLTGSTQACYSCYGNKDTGDGIASARSVCSDSNLTCVLQLEPLAVVTIIQCILYLSICLS